MIYSNEPEKDMLEVLQECSIYIDTNLELLHKDLLYLKHGFNLVTGASKSGKTFTTIKSLVDVGLKEQVIHIDFDRNTDKQLENLGVATFHISNAKELFNKLNQCEKYEPMSNKIIVIDSLQDLGFDGGIDTNSAALDTMNRVAVFGDTGATLIVIHHITLEKGVIANKTTPKIKGNVSTISSKTDCNILLTRNQNQRTMAVQYSRAEDILPSGASIIYQGNTRIAGDNYAIPA